MTCMLLFFHPSQRELNNFVACASGMREKGELDRGWTIVNIKGVEA
jgi:hypothetical protein